MHRKLPKYSYFEFWLSSFQYALIIFYEELQHAIITMFSGHLKKIDGAGTVYLSYIQFI